MLKLMITLLSFCLLWLIPLPTAAQRIPDIDSWPSMEELAGHFFSKYSTHEVESGLTLKLSRNPQGWNVRFERVEDGVVVVDKPLWLGSTKQYVEIAILPLVNDSIYNYRLDSDMSNILSDEDYFGYNLFYGYPQWSEDVIKILEPNLSELTDVSLNQLGRAYAHSATMIVSPSIKETGKYLAFDSTFRADSFSDEMIEKYVLSSKKAINAYEIIKNRNPQYETFVGKIHTVYSNEHLTAFMHLSLINQKDAAKQFLVDGLYTPFLLSLGKRQLESCAKDGILITQGDSDTFLFMYIQEKLGVRQDVSILNKSLISYGRYINYHKNIVSESKRIFTTLPMSAYTLEKFELLVLEESSNDTRLKIRTVIETLIDNPEAYPRYEFYNYRILPSKSFRLSFSGEEVSSNPQAMDSLMKSDSSHVDIDIDGSVLERSELFIWDVLLTNGLKRPLHFVTSMSSHLNLDNYLVNQGLVDTFFPFPSELLETSNADLVEMEFDFNQPELNFQQVNMGYWVLWLKYSYYKAIDQALFNKDNLKATDLLGRMIEYIGNRYAPYGYLDYYFAQFYVTLEEPELAANLLRAVFDDQCIEFEGAVKDDKPNVKEELEAIYNTIKMAFDQFISISDNEKLTNDTKVKFKKIQNTYETFL